MRIIFIVFVTDSKNENQFVRFSTDFQKLPICISPTFLHSSPPLRLKQNRLYRNIPTGNPDTVCLWHPQRESNSQLTLRRGLLYPFNYGGRSY